MKPRLSDYIMDLDFGDLVYIKLTLRAVLNTHEKEIDTLMSQENPDKEYLYYHLKNRNILRDILKKFDKAFECMELEKEREDNA